MSDLRGSVATFVGCANLTALCSGPRGYASTRDVLLLDAVRLCASMPARSTVRRDGDLVWIKWLKLGIYTKSSGGVIEAENLHGGA
ncbi:hypothetical protein ACE6H2_022949 [Prunus campanulata]